MLPVIPGIGIIATLYINDIGLKLFGTFSFRRFKLCYKFDVGEGFNNALSRVIDEILWNFYVLIIEVPLQCNVCEETPEN